MRTILYIAPKLNHYKFLKIDKLAEHFQIDVLCGESEVFVNGSSIRKIIVIKTKKNNFNSNDAVYSYIKENVNEYQIIIIPYEIKFIWLIVRVYLLKMATGRKFRLISYNHPVPKSANWLKQVIFTLITWFSYAILYDRIIFYTKSSCEWAVSKRLVSGKKAFWANNTIDETKIITLREERHTPLTPPRLLMIGRLLEYRWIDRLIDYYTELKKSVPTVELHIIGDGPEKFKIQKAQKILADVYCYGMLIDETKIAKVINQVDFVFIPGHSGLSINHAFSYGKPYITSRDYTNHPPEYDYLKDGINSIILTGNRSHDIEKLKHYITEIEKYNNLRTGAVEAAEKLSIRNWLKQMKLALEL